MTEMSLYEGHGVLYLKCQIFSKYLCQNEDVLKKHFKKWPYDNQNKTQSVLYIEEWNTKWIHYRKKKLKIWTLLFRYDYAFTHNLN